MDPFDALGRQWGRFMQSEKKAKAAFVDKPCTMFSLRVFLFCLLLTLGFQPAIVRDAVSLFVAGPTVVGYGTLSCGKNRNNRTKCFVNTHNQRPTQTTCEENCSSNLYGYCGSFHQIHRSDVMSRQCGIMPSIGTYEITLTERMFLQRIRSGTSITNKRIHSHSSIVECACTLNQTHRQPNGDAPCRSRVYRCMKKRSCSLLLDTQKQVSDIAVSISVQTPIH